MANKIPVYSDVEVKGNTKIEKNLNVNGKVFIPSTGKITLDGSILARKGQIGSMVANEQGLIKVTDHKIVQEKIKEEKTFTATTPSINPTINTKYTFTYTEKTGEHNTTTVATNGKPDATNIALETRNGSLYYVIDCVVAFEHYPSTVCALESVVVQADNQNLSKVFVSDWSTNEGVGNLKVYIPGEAVDWGKPINVKITYTIRYNYIISTDSVVQTLTTTVGSDPVLLKHEDSFYNNTLTVSKNPDQKTSVDIVLPHRSGHLMYAGQSTQIPEFVYVNEHIKNNSLPNEFVIDPKYQNCFLCVDFGYNRIVSNSSGGYVGYVGTIIGPAGEAITTKYTYTSSVNGATGDIKINTTELVFNTFLETDTKLIIGDVGYDEFRLVYCYATWNKKDSKITYKCHVQNGKSFDTQALAFVGLRIKNYQ